MTRTSSSPESAMDAPRATGERTSQKPRSGTRGRSRRSCSRRRVQRERERDPAKASVAASRCPPKRSPRSASPRRDQVEGDRGRSAPRGGSPTCPSTEGQVARDVRLVDDRAVRVATAPSGLAAAVRLERSRVPRRSPRAARLAGLVTGKWPYGDSPSRSARRRSRRSSRRRSRAGSRRPARCEAAEQDVARRAATRASGTRRRRGAPADADPRSGRAGRAAAGNRAGRS